MTRASSRLVRSAEWRSTTTQTDGMIRREALRTEGMWAGKTTTAPGAISGWHHHGGHQSVIYVVKGQVRLETGPGGGTVLEAGSGDFLWVPPNEIHREGNPGHESSTIIVVRGGSGELVVNVDGPEPA